MLADLAAYTVDTELEDGSIDLTEETGDDECEDENETTSAGTEIMQTETDSSADTECIQTDEAQEDQTYSWSKGTPSGVMVKYLVEKVEEDGKRFEKASEEWENEKDPARKAHLKDIMAAAEHLHAYTSNKFKQSLQAHFSMRKRPRKE